MSEEKVLWWHTYVATGSIYHDIVTQYDAVQFKMHMRTAFIIRSQRVSLSEATRLRKVI